jgi:HK97 gp10 family phage protein
MATVEINGLNEVTRSLQKLGVGVEDLKGAFQRIGSKIEAGAKARTPVVSGKFSTSIKQSRRKNSVYLYAGGKRAWHAPYVEFGTKLQKAQRPMTRTLEANKRWGLEEIEKELNTLIRRYRLNG